MWTVLKPFRRDSIEKILRDVLRRGQTPDLQLCGNIAAMMGLHVSGVRVPASQGTRLETPALIPWKEGFALVRAANARGLGLNVDLEREETRGSPLVPSIICRVAPRAVMTLAVVLTIRSNSSSNSTVELNALPTSKSTLNSAMRFLASK